MEEQVVVIGAGMAGLCAALALAPSGRTVTLLERDPPPPLGDPDGVFTDWNRRGVGQLRHSHAFLARFLAIIKAEHPKLHQALLEAGCREIGLPAMLPEALRARYSPKPGDQDMAVLTSRRTTLEWVIRRYVEDLPGVRIQTGAFVRDLSLERPGDGRLVVGGLSGELNGEPCEWRADLVIDTAGRRSPIFERLAELGAGVSEEAEPCGILYYTRHYRLRPGQDEPPRSRAPSTGDLDFLKYGVFPGDQERFSITLAVPEIETELRQMIMRPSAFNQICALLPGVAAWTDAARSEPLSKVFAMGDLSSRWRSFVAPGQRALERFFAVGDSLIRTNPLFGRGCSFAAVEAQLLVEILNQTADPGARARLYDFRLREELGFHYQTMRDQDRAAIARAERARSGVAPASIGDRVKTSFFEDGVRIAVRSDMDLLRAALRDFHMIDPPGAWIKRPDAIAKVVGWWARGKRRNAHLYPPPLGPERGEMLDQLTIAAAQ